MWSHRLGCFSFGRTLYYIYIVWPVFAMEIVILISLTLGIEPIALAAVNLHLKTPNTPFDQTAFKGKDEHLST